MESDNVVTVLMSSYNGEEYIEQQIESIFSQKNVDVRLIVRDDGSSDKTVILLKKLSTKYPIEIIEGENYGYARSFMELIKYSRKITYGYFAFSDQDDVWYDDKLSTAIGKLSQAKKPSLYLSQAIIVDKELNPMNVGFHKRIISLGSTLEHNYAIGCSMVFNLALRDKYDIPYEKMQLGMGHDSWCYLVALAISADVYFDKEGHFLYRQHGNNASGKITNIHKAIIAIKKILVKWKNERYKTGIKLLEIYKDDIVDNKNLDILENVARYKNSMPERIKLAFNKNMYSRYIVVDFLYIISVLFGAF